MLASFSQQALCALPGFDAAPALAALACESNSSAEPPWRFDGPGDCAAPWLGWSLAAGEPRGRGDPEIGQLLASLPAAQRQTALLALAYTEDFAIVDGETGTIPWLAVCLPSRWSPETKVGLHFAALHAPVADNDALLAASAALVELVTGGGRWERFVWTISPDPRLSQHPARGSEVWDSANPATGAWLRSERQTFIPVPGSKQAVFTIGIESEPLQQAVTQAEDAGRLHAALLSMSPAVIGYRGLGPARDGLLAWLAARAGFAAPGPGEDA